MRITILTDNSSINNSFLTEHGLSVFIEKDNRKILFDTGATDAFLDNAKKMNLDLSGIDYIVLSHGHDDHSGGLKYLFNYLKTRTKIIACPDIFVPRYDTDGEFGIPLSKEQIEENLEPIYSSEPYFLTDDIVFLGKIPRNNQFEGKTNVGWNSITKEPDYVTDDSALAIKQNDGIVVITGCSHSGILNICDYAKKILKTDKIISIIGGLHLKDSTIEHIKTTSIYLKELNLKSLYACHCTGLLAQEVLKEHESFKETGAGLEINF